MKRVVTLLTALFCIISTSFSSQRIHHRFESINVGEKARLNVIVPDSYKIGDKKYPVVYFLNGFGGNHGDYPRKSNLMEETDVFDIIAVCIDGATDSWYFDSTLKTNYNYETFVSKEVVEYIDEKYRTIAKREGRAITGLSMGGHGAMYIGLRHPDVFKTVMSMSGALDLCAITRPRQGIWRINKLIGDMREFPEVWANHSAMNQINPKTAGKQNILFDCGESDSFFEMNVAFDKKMTKMKVKHTFESYPGSHSWEYWTLATPRHLTFFTEALKKDKTIK